MDKSIEEGNTRRHVRSKHDSFNLSEKVDKEKQSLLQRNSNAPTRDYTEALDRIRNDARRRLQEIKIEHELKLRAPPAEIT
jgi:hypothetical protein